MEQPALPSPVLAYADLPARHGIQYEVRPDGVIFVLPPPPWWKRPELIALAVVIPLFMLPNVAEIARSNGVAAVGTATATTIVTVVVVAALSRFGHATTIELTSDLLALENVTTGFWTEKAGRLVMRYPRSDVYDVQFVRHSGNIVIRVRGSELIEFSPSRDTKLKEWIATELRRALGLPA